MAAILCLLNDYVIGFEAFQDPAQTTDDWGKWNAEGTEFTPYLDKSGNSQFKVGTVFEKYLAEGNAGIANAAAIMAKDEDNLTDAEWKALESKADLAVANVDKTIAKLVPTLFVALKNTPIHSRAEITLVVISLYRNLVTAKLVQKLKAHFLCFLCRAKRLEYHKL